MSCKNLVFYPIIFWSFLSFGAAEEREYRLPLTHAGYLQLKPHFQQGAKSRTDIYFGCNNCAENTKLRFCQKEQDEICLQHSQKLKEMPLKCGQIPLTLGNYAQQEHCVPHRGKVKNAAELSHAVISRLSRKEQRGAQESWHLLTSLINNDLQDLFTFSGFEKPSVVFPETRNTKLRWYLREGDDPLAAKMKVFLGITFYQDEQGNEQTRYELEAKQKKRTGNIDPEALLCAFIERHGLLASSIDTEIHRQKTYSPKDLQTTITAAKK